MTITVSTPSDDEIAAMRAWPQWSKEVSVFDWHYDLPETCYLLEGAVTVSTGDGRSVSFAAGDKVSFAAGLSCTWTIHAPVRKHYRLG